MNTDSKACHTTESGGTVGNCPWAGDQRSDEKDALLAYATEHREGTAVVVAVRNALNPTAEAGSADHRLALRFYRNHPKWFKTDVRDGIVWVWPRTPALTRLANKHSPKPTEGDGSMHDTPCSPKENARKALTNRQVVENDSTRGYLLDALATYRESTEDRFSRFDRVRGSGPKHILIPYSTRFNEPKRVIESKERLDEAFRIASERHNRAVMVTLTTDPKRYESIPAAYDDLMKDVGRFKSWLDTSGRLGMRPPSVVVPEFTESGIPHVHIVFFGVSWIVSHAELSSYWSVHRGRGEVVWFDRLTSRNKGERWRWADSERPTDVDGRSPRTYLSKTLDTLYELASSAPEAVRSAAGSLRGRQSDRGDDERGNEWWQLALYWALDVPLFTTSPCLKSEDENDRDLPHLQRYRYVGTAQLDEFPGYVIEQAVVFSRKGRG